MGDCCGCCAAFKPRYKRLVDSIYPANPTDGLVKANMDKLTFFAMKSPDKLDRIGEYLAQRLSRDVYRGKHGNVNIAMEALDTLLVTCHAQSLNLFVESFLKMVQKLLECNDTELQCLASASFVKFANIEEDTPSYHRRYDFFVSKFAAMSHDMDGNLERRATLRTSGLHGLQGVVRKTVTDDLQCNIWRPTHMDKIVPSLLFNMQTSSIEVGGIAGVVAEPESPRDEDNPAYVAETVFRDLVCRASYGNINAVIRPVLTHLDNHSLWVPNDFAVHCFKVIMYSVQTQYGYIVVQMLMTHLDENSKKDAKVKASIVDVLSQTVLISAGGSIGPSVLDVFNTLLRHLRISVDGGSMPLSGRGAGAGRASIAVTSGDERRFQESIINTIGEFANNLPDYQKIEIMMFVMGKVPLPSEDGMTTEAEVHLQVMLLMSLLKVATKYKTVLLTNAFPPSFLDPLLRMSLSTDAGVRRVVQEILHALIDRHGNIEKFHTPEVPKDVVTRWDLNVEPPPRQDLVFMKKNGAVLFSHLYENVQQPNNKVDNYERIYTTMALLCVELGAGGGDELLADELRLSLTIQSMAVASALPITHKCAIHSLVAAHLNLVAQLSAVAPLCQHVTKVIETRRKVMPCYLPEIAFYRGNTSSVYPDTDEMSPDWLFDAEVIGRSLGADHDTARLSTPFAVRPSALGIGELSRSISDIQSLNLGEIDSAASTPTAARRSALDDVTFESMKRILEVDPRAKEQERRHQQQIYESFRTGPFEALVARSEASARHRNRLDEILNVTTELPQPASFIGGAATKSDRSPGTAVENGSAGVGQSDNDRDDKQSVPVHEMQFPELFVY